MLGIGQSSASAGKELTAPHQFPPWLMRLSPEGNTTHEDPHHRPDARIRCPTGASPSERRRSPTKPTRASQTPCGVNYYQHHHKAF